MSRTQSRSANVAIGAIAIAVATALLVGALALFNREFTEYDRISVQTPRAGLLMSKGGAVKIRGVEIGKVAEVRSADGGAVLDLDIEQGHLGLIPADARARIVPTTVFGNKYVEIASPATDDFVAIAPGAVIAADHVTVEVNTAFAALVRVLGSAQPRRVNSALNATAAALRGNGKDIARAIASLNSYLVQLQPSLPLLQADILNGSQVARQYAALVPDLIDVLDSGITISDTLVSNRVTLNSLLVGFGALADRTDELVRRNAGNLETTLRQLDPTLRLLARYSPQLPCLIEGLAIDADLASDAFGGPVPGINGIVGLLPAQEPYQNPRDLPEVGAAGVGPSCYGLPQLTPGKLPPHPYFHTGEEDPYAGDILQGGTAGTSGGLAPVYLNQLLGSVLGLSQLVPLP